MSKDHLLETSYLSISVTKKNVGAVKQNFAMMYTSTLTLYY